MARLNELSAPVPAESLESLKRRFVRQNRDLARSNSVQSLKIRQLETELARLRADNVVLGERVINLETELEDVTAGRSSTRQDMQQLDNVRINMEKSLGEMMGLLTEWNKFSTEQRQRRRRTQAPAGTVERLSPDSRRQRRMSQRRAFGLDAADEENDGRLPGISEDKSYPRSSLDALETARLHAERTMSDSPDLGPPPKAHFDHDMLLEHGVHDKPLDDGREPVPHGAGLLSANLETRRRRRASMSGAPEKISTRQTDSLELPGDRASSDAGADRSTVGSKRKWDACSAREMDREEPSGNDEFAYTKANGKAPDNQRDHGAALDQVLSKPLRKALAPKPVNTDPVVSPKKNRTVDSKPKGDVPDGDARARSRTSVRSRPNGLHRLDFSTVAEGRPQIKVSDIRLDTEEAHLDDMFSPSLDGPSRPETPPSAPSAGGIEGPTGIRGSRRARPQISYAEPNLVSKMRRPGKELIDAVSKDARRSSANLMVLDQRLSEPLSAHSASVQRLRDGETLASASEELQSPSLREQKAATRRLSRASLADDAQARRGAMRKGAADVDADDVYEVQASPSASSQAASELMLPPHSMTTTSRARVRRTTIGGEKSRLGPPAPGLATTTSNRTTSRRRTLDTRADPAVASSSEPWASDSDQESSAKTASASTTRPASTRGVGRRRSMMV